MTTRHAIYFVPDDHSALGHFGARLFGRWPDGSSEHDTLTLPQRAARTRRVAHYGFHATLKAPFMLAKDHSEAGLLAALEAACTTWRPASLAGLEVSANASQCRLSLGRGSSAAAQRTIADIAKHCVTRFEAFRAPLTPRQRARRQPDQLDAVEREHLDRYGYPWVLDRFHFHMTLSDQLGDSADGAWLAALTREFQQCLSESPTLDRVAVCRESSPTDMMVRIAEFRLECSK